MANTTFCRLINSVATDTVWFPSPSGFHGALRVMLPNGGDSHHHTWTHPVLVANHVLSRSQHCTQGLVPRPRIGRRNRQSHPSGTHVDLVRPAQRYPFNHALFATVGTVHRICPVPAYTTASSATSLSPRSHTHLLTLGAWLSNHTPTTPWTDRAAIYLSIYLYPAERFHPSLDPVAIPPSQPLKSRSEAYDGRSEPTPI